MMQQKKTRLLIMRHAHSDRGDIFVDDFDRSLSARGRNEARSIAQKLSSLGVSIDKALVSPSTRTKETWQILAAELKITNDPIMIPELYQASVLEVLDILLAHSNDNHNLLLLAHCPAVADVISHLSHQFIDVKPSNCAILLPQEADLFQSIVHSSFRFEQMVKT